MARNNHTHKFIEGATAGAALGAVGSLWILNEIPWYLHKKGHHLTNNSFKIILGSTVAAAAFTGLLYVLAKPEDEKSWETKIKKQNSSNAFYR